MKSVKIEVNEITPGSELPFTVLQTDAAHIFYDENGKLSALPLVSVNTAERWAAVVASVLGIPSSVQSQRVSK